jgi:hypothetical protein
MGTAGGRTQAGNRILIGTDPVLHNFTQSLNDPRAPIIREGIAFAGKQTGRTGLYFNTSCGGASTNVLPALGLLSTGSGSWTVNAGPPCGGAVSLIASEPTFATLTTVSLADWQCSVHQSWPTFASDWSALAVATDTTTRPTCGVDPNTQLSACGQAYILIAGSSIVVVSDSIAVTPTDATNPVGTSHTVTARVTNDGVPQAGVTVTFTVTGRNTDAPGTCAPAQCVTNASGEVSFTYLGANGAGDDTIKASFTDSAGSLQSATAQKHWESVAGVPTIFPVPDWVEDVEVDLDFTPQEDEVRTAYLSAQEAGVRILDVTDPDAINNLGSYDPDTCPNGGSMVPFFADDVSFVELESLDALFVAAGRCGVIVLDVSDPAAPLVLGRYDTPVWAEAVEVKLFEDSVIGYIADHNGGLVIVDFSNLFDGTPSAPVLLGAIGSSTPGWGTGAAIDVAILDNEVNLLAFVATTQGLRVVGVNNPMSPQLIGSYNSPAGNPPEVSQDISLSEDGDTAFIAGWQAGLLAIDVSDPTEPALLGRISTSPGNAYYESEIDGSVAFATEGKLGLRTFTVGEGGLEEIDGEEPIPIAGGDGWAWDVQTLNGVAYVTFGILENGTGGLAVIELEGSGIPVDFSGDPGPDGDGDGTPDADDNCSVVANADQADANQDGFGDACDADYNEDGFVSAADFSILRAAFGSTTGDPRWNAEVDHDGNGAISAADFSVMRARLGTPPGPSGLSCAGSVPCPSP